MPKKIVSFILVFVLILSISIPAFAATIQVTEVPKDEQDYFGGEYVYAEVWLDDVHELKAYLGKGTMSQMAEEANALFAINGDFWTYDNDNKLILRNGELKRDMEKSKSVRDYCVIYNDGRVQQFRHENVRNIDFMVRDAWQVFSFGPILVHHSIPETDFSNCNSESVAMPGHPRTAIGYFEPNHFCFLVVAGRNLEDKGASLEAMAQFFADKGCTEAYNLDGGGSSHVWYNGKELGDPSQDRVIPDIIYIEKESGN